MKNENNQPKHTQGELKEKDAHIFCVEKIGDKLHSKLIARTFIVKDELAPQLNISKEEAIANAQRIVKAVNMHDDFVKGLKRLQGIEAWIGDRQMKELFQDVTQTLLKQAEGK